MDTYDPPQAVSGPEDSTGPVVVPFPERVTYAPAALQSFIDRVFHTRREDEHVLTWVTKPAGQPRFPTDSTETLYKLSRTSAPRALYYGTSTCQPDPADSRLYNRLSLLDRLHVVVLDDIGSKVPVESLPDELREPSYIVETSEGNYQYGYVLDEPVDDAEHARALVRAIYSSGYSDAGGAMPTKLVRLPGGINGKPGKTDWVVRLVDDNGPDWTPDALLRACKCTVTWDEIKRDPSAAAKRNRSRPATEWSGIAATSPNTDGGVDPVLEWLYGEKMVKQETGEWATIECPWANEHTEGDRTAGYSPLGRGEGDFRNRRSFKCFHDHCAHRNGEEFLQWIAAQGGPELPAYDPAVDLLTQWVYDPADNCAWQVWGTKQFQTSIPITAFRNLYPKKATLHQRDGSKKLVSVVDLWLRSPARITVDGAIFDPTTDTPLTEVQGSAQVNLYRRPDWRLNRDWTDEDTGHVEMFKRFLEYLVPRDSEREYVTDWLAAKITTPSFRGAALLMIAQRQGTGRGTLADMVRTLLGFENTANLTFDRLTAGAEFNDWQRRPLVVVDETFDIGTRRDKSIYRAYERLKGLIDVAPVSVLINEKYRSPRPQLTYTSYLMFSNHTGALAVAPDDRRTYVAANAFEPESPEYFTRLYQWKNALDDTGRPAWAPAIYKWLADREPDMGVLLGPAPKTAAKDAMLEATRAPGAIVMDIIIGHWNGPFLCPHIVREVFSAVASRIGMDGSPAHSRALIMHRVNEVSLAMHQTYRCTSEKHRVRPRLINSYATAEARAKYIDQKGRISAGELTEAVGRNKIDLLTSLVQESLYEYNL